MSLPLSGDLARRWRRREWPVGMLRLSTVPPTVAPCARNRDTRRLATIFGIVVIGHQPGGFTGAFLGGRVFGILVAAFAALIRIPVRDGPPAAPAAV